MTKALEAAGHRTGWPMVEVYGHWTNDESKLETETFVELRCGSHWSDASRE